MNGRRVAAVVVWWCALWLLWFAYTGEWNPIEWVAAACAATVASALAGVLLARGLLDARVPLGWVAKAWNVPIQIVADFGIVTLALVRALLGGSREPGRFFARDFPAGGDDPTSRGIRAFASIVGGYSPNAYVVHVDEELGLALVHDLIPNKASEKPIGA